MNTDMLQGEWKKLRGEVKQWWGKLTDDDLTAIDGNKDKLIGTLQQKYGYTREQAQREVDQRMNQYDSMHRS